MASTSAPGKLILCGEYAVLRGAPALVMAIDRRAAVRITPHEQAGYVLTTPGLAEGRWRFEQTDDGGIAWLDNPPASARAIPETVFAETGLASLPPAHVEIDSRTFADPASDAKYGFGSSAAATVALVAALLGPDAAAVDTWKIAKRAHFAMHGGSGADIAASCFGGLLQYDRHSQTAPAAIQWPTGLEFRVLFSRVSASTGEAIEKSRLEAIGDGEWCALEASAASAADAWRQGDAKRAVTAMREFTEELRRFDKAGAGTIFSAGHEELAALGDELGVVYKPSGAGGGDCGIAFGVDTERLQRFSEAATSRGFVPLEVQRDNKGV